MDLKKRSPPPKPAKVSSSTTYYDEHLMFEVARSRKLTIKHIQVYCFAMTNDFDRIMNTAVVSKKLIKDRGTIPEIDERLLSVDSERYEGFIKDGEKATKECKELMMLMSIVEQKRKCPVSKIVDGI